MIWNKKPYLGFVSHDRFTTQPPLNMVFSSKSKSKIYIPSYFCRGIDRPGFCSIIARRSLIEYSISSTNNLNLKF